VGQVGQVEQIGQRNETGRISERMEQWNGPDTWIIYCSMRCVVCSTTKRAPDRDSAQR